MYIMMAGLGAGLLTASHQHQHDECATVDMCWLHCPVYWILIATLDNGEENTAPRPRPRGSPWPLADISPASWLSCLLFSYTINYADGGGRRKTLIVVIVVSSLSAGSFCAAARSMLVDSRACVNILPFSFFLFFTVTLPMSYFLIFVFPHIML